MPQLINIPITEKLTIEKLHEKLMAENIPHEYDHHINDNPPCVEWNLIIYPSRENFVGDFMQHYSIRDGNRILGFSYGADENLMEGMGFDICREKDGDTVKGWIDLDEAYEMIKKAHEERNGK